MPKVRRCRAAGCHAMVSTDHWYCLKHRDQEAAYLKSRAKWARGHEATYQHKYNTITRNRSQGKTDQYKFYRSKTWQSLRVSILERDSHLCQYCLADGIYTQGNTVDHIVPIEFNPSKKGSKNNLATICPKCHKLKTKWEQKYYGTGKENLLKNNKNEINSIEIINSLMR